MMFWARRNAIVNIAGILLFVVVFALLGSLTLSAAPASDGPGKQLLLYLSVLITTYLMARLLDRRDMTWVGLGIQPRMPRELAIGVIIGGAAAAIAWAPTAAAGTLRIGLGAGATGLLTQIAYTALLAAGEEILFRGYVYQRITEIVGITAGTLLTALLFAVAHIGNPGMTFMAGVNLFAAGLLFAAAWIVTGSLWTSIGMHVAWNVVLADVLGAPTSGLVHANALLSTSASGPELLTGGSFGPEGGIVTTIVLIGAGLALFRLRSLGFSPYTFSRLFWGVYRQKSGSNPS